MNARQQLRALQAQRDVELRAASRHALRLSRNLSPTRHIRTHMPAALGIALLAGIALAPAPRYRRESSSRSRGPSFLMSLIQKLFPSWHNHLTQFLPPDSLKSPPESPTPAAAAQPAPQPAPTNESPLVALLLRLVQEVNWAVLIARLAAHFAPPPPASDPAPASPMPAESAELPH